MNELIEEIDEILARYEDWMHGKNGDDCTKARKLLHQLRDQCALADVSGSLLVEIKNLFEQYRDEEMPDWNKAFHYDAEGWAAMKYFIQWLERKSNDR